jgi:hypothetical protein
LIDMKRMSFWLPITELILPPCVPTFRPIAGRSITRGLAGSLSATGGSSPPFTLSASDGVSV